MSTSQTTIIGEGNEVKARNQILNTGALEASLSDWEQWVTVKFKETPLAKPKHIIIFLATCTYLNL